MKLQVTHSDKFKRRLAILLCAVISPIVLYWLLTWGWLIEILRVDEYSYGGLFYLVIIMSSLACNALFVHIVCNNSSKDEKIRLWIKGSLIAPLFALTAVFLYFMIDILMHGARWSFG